jgi:hypothetical protein
MRTLEVTASRLGPQFGDFRLLMVENRHAHVRVLGGQIRRLAEQSQRRGSFSIQATRTLTRFARQIGECKRAEDSPRRLSGRLLRLRVDDRRRFAREQHDSTSHPLSGRRTRGPSVDAGEKNAQETGGALGSARGLSRPDQGFTVLAVIRRVALDRATPVPAQAVRCDSSDGFVLDRSCLMPCSMRSASSRSCCSARSVLRASCSVNSSCATFSAT